MFYFNYVPVDEKSAEFMLRVYETVYSLVEYAKTIYGSYAYDVLDKSFFHVLDNYRSDKGDLRHYSIAIVKTIGLGRYSKEVEHEITLLSGLDSNAIKDTSTNPLEIISNEDYSDDMQECINYLVPFFVKDFKFFCTSRREDRKLSYKGIFSKFDYDVVGRCMKYLVSKYKEDISSLYDFKSDCHMRSFTDERIAKSVDSAVAFEGVLNDVILYKCKQRCKRFFYTVDIEELIYNIDKVVYQSGVLHRVVEQKDIYLTLSGNIVIGKKECLSELENSVIGSIFARLPSVKLVNYENGVLIIASAKSDMCGLTLDSYGFKFPVQFNSAVAKKIGVIKC